MRKLFLIAAILPGFFCMLIPGCKPEIEEREGFPAGRVFSLHIAPSGVVWAGSDVGLISFDGTDWKTHNTSGVSEGDIRDFAQSISGPGNELWMASSLGATMAISEQDEISSAISYTQRDGKLLDNNLRAVVLDSLDTKWFATALGLSILKESQWFSEDEYGDLTRYPVISLGVASNGWIFAGTSGMGVGRYQLIDEVDGVSGASYYDKSWSGLRSDSILSIYINPDNTQWFGTTRGVAFHNIWETKKGWENYDTSHGLVSNRVQCIDREEDGTMWFGTPAGISSFDGENWTSYKLSDGIGNEEINDLKAGPKGQIWFATNQGVSVFDGSSWTVYSRE